MVFVGHPTRISTDLPRYRRRRVADAVRHHAAANGATIRVVEIGDRYGHRAGALQLRKVFGLAEPTERLRPRTRRERRQLFVGVVVILAQVGVAITFGVFRTLQRQERRDEEQIRENQERVQANSGEFERAIIRSTPGLTEEGRGAASTAFAGLSRPTARVDCSGPLPIGDDPPASVVFVRVVTPAGTAAWEAGRSSRSSTSTS